MHNNIKNIKKNETAAQKKASTRKKSFRQYNRQIPERDKDEPFPELMIDKRHVSIGEDYLFATDMRKGFNFPSFFKLLMMTDRLDGPEYKMLLADPVTHVLFKPERKENGGACHFVYTIYSFIDQLTQVDNFEMKRSILQYLPLRNTIHKRIDLIPAAICLKFDYRRRAQLCQRPARPKYEYNNYCQRNMPAARFLISKNEKLCPPIFGQALASNQSEIEKSMKNGFSSLEKKLEKDFDNIKQDVKIFLNKNKKWKSARLNFKNDPILLHLSIKSLKDFINRHDENPFRLRNELDLFNEFNYFPSHFAFSVHFCRVLRSFSLNPMQTTFTITKKKSEKCPFIKVKPSRYRYNPAITILDDENEKFLKTQMEKVARRAPSVESISGFSSDSAASTATQTPLDWALNWKMQDKDYEHRYSKTGVFNMVEIGREAQDHFKNRLFKEMTRRRLLVNQANEQYYFEPSVPLFKEGQCMRRTHWAILDILKELKKMKTKFEREAQKRDIVVQISLARRFNHLEKMLPRIESEEEGITLTNGWAFISESADRHIVSNIGRILRQRCEWIESNCWSTNCSVPRCDRITIKKKKVFKQLILVLIMLITFALTIANMALLSFQ